MTDQNFNWQFAEPQHHGLPSHSMGRSAAIAAAAPTPTLHEVQRAERYMAYQDAQHIFPSGVVNSNSQLSQLCQLAHHGPHAQTLFAPMEDMTAALTELSSHVHQGHHGQTLHESAVGLQQQQQQQQQQRILAGHHQRQLMAKAPSAPGLGSWGL